MRIVSVFSAASDAVTSIVKSIEPAASHVYLQSKGPGHYVAWIYARYEPGQAHCNDLYVGGFTYSAVIGCPYLVAFGGADISPRFRGKGLGSLFHDLRLKDATESGFAAAICTVREGNAPQERIMDKFGWRKANSFVKKNRIAIWTKELNERLG